jgi:hypothetical protein
VNRSILFDHATMFVAALALLFVFTAPGMAKRSSGSIDGPSAQADCTAQCQDGSTVTCSGSSCSADDYDCDTGERGQCTGSSGTRYCPVPDCSTCSVSITCPDGTWLSCSSNENDCEGFQGLCYVRCDGIYQFCPGHFGEVFCEL